MYLDFARFLLVRVIPFLAFSTIVAPFPALSQNPEPEPTPDCLAAFALHFFEEVSSKCGPYADPKDWYQPENECTIKAAEAFDLCKNAGYEARYIQIDCRPAPGHAVVGCKIEGKWIIIDTSDETLVRAALDTEALLQSEFMKQEPPILSLMKGDTPTDQFACFLAGKDPRTGCGCVLDPAGGNPNCQCKAHVESSVPATGPVNTGFCARVQEMDPAGFSARECKECCKNRHKFLLGIEKPTCDGFVEGCAQSLLDDLQSPPGNPTGIIADNLYLGLMALWRCDQWPQQTQAFLEKCEQACDAKPGRLAKITLRPRSSPDVAGRGAIMTKLKDVPGVEGKCTNPTTCELPLVKGKTLILTAKPKDASVAFKKWTGLCTGTNQSCSIVVSTPGTVMADFDKLCALEDENVKVSKSGNQCCNGLTVCTDGFCRKSCVRNLTVKIVGGGGRGGSVSDLVGKIKCPGTCAAASQPYGSSHTLMPTSNMGFQFVRWEGCTRENGINCIAVLTGKTDKTVKAIFKPECINTCGDRKCGPDGCGGICGECGPQQTCNANAGLCENPYTLSLAMVMGRGAQGSVSFTPPRAACTSQCERQFPRGSSVTLTATATDGRFERWEGGGCTGSNPTCTVSMNAAKSVAAQFDKPCVPNCDNKQCGSNGCHGICGRCMPDETCSLSGICIARQICSPDCMGKQCGSDGCNGTCPNLCSPGQTCSSTGQCQSGSGCTPSCGTRTCGPNGCGGFCGPQETCSETAPTCSIEGGSCYATTTVTASCCAGLRCNDSFTCVRN